MAEEIRRDSRACAPGDACCKSDAPNEDPVFSLVVPVYNVAQYLGECVNSILAQEFDSFEIVLVDDGSTDGSAEICDRFAQASCKVRVVHKANGGLVSARNAGIAAARGRYVCSVDGDDWIAPDYLVRVYGEAVAPHDPDVVLFGLRKVLPGKVEDIAAGPAPGYYDKERLAAEVHPRMMYDPMKPFCTPLVFPSGCSKAIKRELLLQHHCTDEGIRMGEDNAFTYECLANANSACALSGVLYFYRRDNRESITNVYDARRFENDARLFRYMEPRITGISDAIDAQFNAFKAYWLIMAIFHDVKCGLGVTETRRHLKAQLKQYRLDRMIRLKGLPKSAALYIGAIKMHCYFVAALGAHAIQQRREGSHVD